MRKRSCSTRFRPIRCRKIRYFADLTFPQAPARRHRLKPPPISRRPALDAALRNPSALPEAEWPALSVPVSDHPHQGAQDVSEVRRARCDGSGRGADRSAHARRLRGGLVEDRVSRSRRSVERCDEPRAVASFLNTLER